MQIEQYNTQKLSLNSENIETKARETAPNIVSKKEDLISISPESAEFTRAVDTVRREMHYSRQTGYFDPPPYLSNGKQREIIGNRIAGLLSSPSDNEQLETAAESLWKEIGYRDENKPSPDPFRGSGLVYDYLTKQDRKDMDLVYDEYITQGKNEYEKLEEVAVNIAMERNKQSKIAAGAIFYSSDHISSSTTFGPNATGVVPPEYSRDIDPRFNRSIEPELQDTDLKQAQELLQNMIDNITGTAREKREKISIFQNISDVLAKRISDMADTATE